MNRSFSYRCLIALGAAVGVCAFMVNAAPKLADQPKLTDDVISLARITQVELRVMPVPKLPADHGLTDEQVTELLNARLRRAVIKVVRDADAPTVQLKMVPIEEPALPDALAFNTRLLLYQRTQIGRLHQELVVPTYCDFNISLDRRASTKETAIASGRDVVSRFGSAVHIATRKLTEPN